LTLHQLKYVVEVADRGSINEAAKNLFISQPSLSNAIKELENEIKTTIFIRTNRGVVTTAEGAEFLGYARQVIQQTELLEDKYLKNAPVKQYFSISTHHYLFAANAFVELVKEFGGDAYEFALRETKTYEIIEDVKNLRSEIGIIYLSEFNSAVILKLLKENDLIMDELFEASPHIFLYKHHPFAKRDIIQIEELDEYPCITFEQGEHNSFYFSEEILSTRNVKKSIKVSDRAAVVNFMIGLNGYHVSTGVFPEYLHGDDIVAVKLDSNEKIKVITIMNKDVMPTELGKIYMEALKRVRG